MEIIEGSNLLLKPMGSLKNVWYQKTLIPDKIDRRNGQTIEQRRENGMGINNPHKGGFTLSNSVDQTFSVQRVIKHFVRWKIGK